MSAKHAVLGLVIERPGYGYQLAQRLTERCGTWGWEPTGVYSALDQLDRGGYVHCVGMHGSGTSRRPPRPIYGATDQGRDFFAGWMNCPSVWKPLRQELDLKLLFSTPEFLPSLVEQTKEQERLCLAELASLKHEPGLSGGPVRSWAEATALLRVDAEIKLLEVRVQWLQQVRATIREMLDR